MNKPTNISTLRFETPKRKFNVQHLLWVVLFIGFCVGVYRVADDSMDAIYLNGMSDGNTMAVREFKGAIKREMLKTERVAYCMNFWFNENKTTVGDSLAKVKVSK